MKAKERIRQSLILEKMRKSPEAARRLGLKDLSIIKNEPLKPNNTGSHFMK